MSPSTNKKRPALTISVKYTLITFAFSLLLAGIGVTATEQDRPDGPVSRTKQSDAPPSHSPEQRSTPPFSGDGKFLASLKFWEKKKSPPPQNSPTPPVQTPTQPQVAGGGQNPRHTEAPLPQNSLGTSGTNTNVILEANAEQENATFGDAPMPGEQFANLSEHPDGMASRNARGTTASYSSYSYDIRDWVEYYPIPREQELILDEIQPVKTSETQATTVWTPIETPPQEQSKRNEDQWNGQTTMLASHVQRSAQPAETSVTVATTVKPVYDVPQPPSATPSATAVERVPNLCVDLTPSYRNRLPYVQTCGVVVVQANFPLTEITSILDEIELLQHDLTRYIGVPAPKEKIELCLFKNEASYIRFLQEFFPRAPSDRRALYVKLDDKPGTLMVQQSKDFEVDLRHEMTHAIVHASIPKVPIWLDEGLAKYFEVPSHERANGHPYMAKVRANAKFNMVPLLDRLTRLETIDDMGTKEYQDSWAWTHFLIHRSPETQQLLAAYLQMLSRLNSTGDSSASDKDSLFSGGVIGGLNVARGREKQAAIPSLKLYLDDIMSNQRETFKEHFGARNSEESK